MDFQLNFLLSLNRLQPIIKIENEENKSNLLQCKQDDLRIINNIMLIKLNVVSILKKA